MTEESLPDDAELTDVTAEEEAPSERRRRRVPALR